LIEVVLYPVAAVALQIGFLGLISFLDGEIEVVVEKD